jgi:prevent-host-death family protein
MSWQIQEAKAKFSELVKMAMQSPQFVTARGKPAVVIMSQKEYEKLVKPKVSFLELMRGSPLNGVDFEFERDRSLPRKSDFS